MARIERRCESIARYMLANKSTVRQAAAHFGVCKSTVHLDVTANLKKVNKSLYEEVQVLLAENWNDRQRRGGITMHNRKLNKNNIASSR